MKISSSVNDPNYQGSTMIDITKQTIISDIDMQYFTKKTVPMAGFAPENPSTIATGDKQQAITNVIDSLKIIQKKYEVATKLLILEGMYKEKNDFNKLANKNEIYNVNKKPVPNDWFENKTSKKPALIKFFYGSVKKEEAYFFPIWINIT